MGQGDDHDGLPFDDTEVAGASGAAARVALAPGTRLGRYVIEAPLGAGGMGVVWAAPPAPSALAPPRRLGDLGDPMGFSPDGRWLLVAVDARPGEIVLARYPVARGAAPEPGPWLRVPWEDGWLDDASASPDGRRAVVSLIKVSQDLWIVERL
jgi:hypothetical protein